MVLGNAISLVSAPPIEMKQVHRFGTRDSGARTVPRCNPLTSKNLRLRRLVGNMQVAKLAFCVLGVVPDGRESAQAKQERDSGKPAGILPDGSRQSRLKLKCVHSCIHPSDAN